MRAGHASVCYMPVLLGFCAAAISGLVVRKLCIAVLSCIRLGAPVTVLLQNNAPTAAVCRKQGPLALMILLHT